MKKTFFVLLAGFLFLILTAGDCKKTNGPSDNAPIPPTVTFSGPGTQDACSVQAYGIVQYANSFSTELAIFASLQPNANGDTYTWGPLTLDSLTVTVTAMRQGDGSFTWEVKYDGVEDGITYTNKVIASGTTSADGKSGTFTAYYPQAAAVLGTFEYAISGTNVATGTFIEYDSQGLQSDKIDLVSNPDGSGEATTSTWNGSAWVQDFHATWTSSGGQATCS